MTDWKDILNNEHGELSDDRLNAYLEGRLSPEEQREVEALLSEESMESDAVEGLKDISVNDIHQLTEKVNYRLKHDVRKQSHRSRKTYADNKWAWLAIIIVVLLCVLGYWVVKMMN